MQRFIFTIALLLLAPRACALAARVDLCNLHVESEDAIDFSETETKWLCGDAGTEAWKSIPVSQQRLFLRSFLQERGYHAPTFREENQHLYVQAGVRHRVKAFTVTGHPPAFDPTTRRKLLGRGLDPAALNDTVNWTRRQLSLIGYPCAKVEPRAFLAEGEVHLEVTPGPLVRFPDVHDHGASDLDPRILERFTAFRTGQVFDQRLLELTSDRILQEDIYLSTFYDVACGPNQQPTITRRFVPAAPRLITFGAGFDTERGPILRARWKRVRLSPKANSLQATTFLSFREQNLELRYRDHFPRDPGSRFEFAPRLQVVRLDEKLFQSITYRLEPALATSWEFERFRLGATAGPVFERTDTLRGPGPRHVNSARVATELRAMSHLFEYYLGDPRSGWNISLETSSQFAGFGSRQTVQRALLRQEVLWNLAGFDPPLLVLGWRGYVGSFFYNQRQEVPPDIPVNDRYFLGGDDDIRGFGRKKLSADERGYFTTLYQGVELRLVEVLPFKLQPFVFFDLAKGGRRPHHLDSTTYYSPGLGLRWASPVGTLRFSLARGYASRALPGDPVPNLQFFVSFGKEF